MDMTLGIFFVSETPSAVLCQAIIILQGGAPFHPLEILPLILQV